MSKQRQNTTTFTSAVADAAAPAFAVTTTGGGPDHLVVHVSGDFDIAARSAVGDAALSDGAFVDVNLANTRFMDCSGYGVLIAVDRLLRDHNGSLTILNLAGQPDRLFKLIASVESETVNV